MTISPEQLPVYPTSVLSLQRQFPACNVNEIVEAVRIAGPSEQHIIRFLGNKYRRCNGNTARRPAGSRASLQ